MGALHLVQEGKLDLDSDVNRVLVTWKVPDSNVTRIRKVTLRELLSHSAGTSVHGFVGYAPGALLPTQPQILDGVPPANTPAVRVEDQPGSLWR
jgi:CubicO group peptidase (beta-lactamase class C family)